MFEEQGYGATWCNGQCYWYQGNCWPRYGVVGSTKNWETIAFKNMILLIEKKRCNTQWAEALRWNDNSKWMQNGLMKTWIKSSSLLVLKTIKRKRP